MSKRLSYMRALTSLQSAHTLIHKSLSAFKKEKSDAAVLAQMLEAYSELKEALEAMGYTDE
mgnify:CR=1 FL=1